MAMVLPCYMMFLSLHVILFLLVIIFVFYMSLELLNK